MLGDGINDGKFIVKKGGLSQAIAAEMGLTDQQTKQLGSIWTQIFAEVDKQQQQNIAEGKSAIYSGGNDLKGNANKNYVVTMGKVVEFSKEIWANIVKLVNVKLKTNIQIATNESNSTSTPTSNNSKENVNKAGETMPGAPIAEDSEKPATSIDGIDLKDLFKSIGAKRAPEAIAQSLIDEIFGGRANLDEIMPEIDGENVLDVLKEYKKLSDEKNTKLGILMDDETLIEAILDETIPKEKKKEYINHIKDALVEKMNSLGGNSENLSKIFEKAIDKVLNWPTGLQSARLLNKLVDDFIKAMDKLNELEYLNLVKKSLESQGIDTSDFLGNGKFDNPSKQMTGNCWAHAGINAMIQSEAGKAYLNKLIKKDEITGDITIYLPGAEKQGLPKPKGDGKYTYTELEIGKRADNTAGGDGDYTALMLAIEDFRKESLNDPNATSDAGSITDFCNIILGNDDNIVFHCSKEIGGNKEALVQAFEKGLALVVSLDDCSILLENYDIEKSGDRHAVAIKSIDAERDVAIIIDSNYPDKLIEVDLDILIENCIIFGLNIPS